MATFTLVDDRTIVTQDNMRLGGKMRLHLAGVGGNRKAIQLHSTNPRIAGGRIIALFNGPKGIWTVEIDAFATGKAEIHAKHNGKVVAKLQVTVAKKLTLPAATTQEGMLVRLFLAESPPPAKSSYNATDAKKGMQWMRLVLENRLKNNPGQFLAPGAKTITDIVRARGQVEGFENYPTLKAGLQARINDIVKIANDDSDRRQEKHETFLLNALEVATGKAVVLDPCPTRLYGWRTADSRSPGGRFKKYGTPLSGNQFYTLEPEKPSK
ncbi:hypothetical protein [Candidatus Thiosymbion oneisti]|uniref:hypothetical protein n=1 Tax=Candidatus Thiosymbion oneisti TaxID=589554 RepID=UPI000B7D55D9|nr:hypothetical protein [Candidatus Thiosymbion oneisti]